MHTYLKPRLASVASCKRRASTAVNLQTRVERPSWSKPGLSECGLGAGSGPAKRQRLPSTCSRAVRVDGSDDRAGWTVGGMCK